MISHLNIQRVHPNLIECLCSFNMGVITLTKLQIEMSIKLKESCISSLWGQADFSHEKWL